MKVREYNKKLSAKHQADLHKDLAEQREVLRDLRFKASQNQLKEVRTIREVRKNIARIMTALRGTKHSANSETQAHTN